MPTALTRLPWSGCRYCLNPKHPGPCAKPGSKAYERRHGKGKGKKQASKKQSAPRGDAATGKDAIDAAPLRRRGRGDTYDGDRELAASVDYYSQAGYLGINEDLRAGITTDPRTSGHIATLDAGMAASKLKQPVQVTRSIRAPTRVFGDQWNDDDVTGLTWRDDSFVSTTANTGLTGRNYYTGTGGAVMTLYVPAGTSALGASSTGETELLLDRGLIYRVTADRGLVDGIRHLDVEVVGG